MFKPDNVLVGVDGRPRVTDFGLVYTNESPQRNLELAESLGRMSAGDALTTELTVPGSIMGTPAYMAPEQFTGQPVDARSDQFSFCVALWEALYGKRPFAGENFAQLVVAVTSGHVSLPEKTKDIPPWVQDALLRGLSLDPSGRWPSISALLAALERRSDFEISRAPRNASALQLEAILGLVFVPGFWALDWYVIPEHLTLSLAIRLTCAAYAAAILWLKWKRPRTIERFSTLVSVSFSLLVAWSIAMMCFLHTGYESPYYAGINLLVLCVGLLYSWPTRIALLFNLGIYIFYLSPLMLGLLEVHDGTTALSNQVFMISTMIVTAVSQGYRRRLEFNEFYARANQERLEAHLLTDISTGFYTRNHFFRIADDELERARRHQYPLSLILLSFQHVVTPPPSRGLDEEYMMKAAATRLAATVRRCDVIARLGNLKFAILLPEIDRDSAQSLAESMCAAIGELQEFQPTRVGGSVIVNIAVEIAVQTEDFFEAIARAEIGLAGVGAKIG